MTKDRAAILTRAGKILFGENWKEPFANNFDIRLQTVGDMAKGKREVPDSLLAEIETALHDHGHALDDLLTEFIDRE
jgi:hypothetical protein